MKHFLWNTASFVTSSCKTNTFPPIVDINGDILPEITLAGRSNSGKSSLINMLFGIRLLAKTSSAPGKTQAVNFFRLDDRFAFSDLPGYGYAKVPMSVKASWGSLIEGYLKNRKSLSLMLLIVDIRRGLTHDDQLLIDWSCFHRKELIVILTKCDKVTAHEKRICHDATTTYLSNKDTPVVYFSSKTGEGKDLLRSLIRAWNGKKS